MKGSSRKKKKRVKIDFRQEEEEREGKRREDVERINWERGGVGNNEMGKESKGGGSSR